MANVLPRGLQKHIRRQKLVIKRLAKSPEEESQLVKELLGRFYRPVKEEPVKKA
jgi:hypothetical protein